MAARLSEMVPDIVDEPDVTAPPAESKTSRLGVSGGGGTNGADAGRAAVATTVLDVGGVFDEPRCLPNASAEAATTTVNAPAAINTTRRRVFCELLSHR